MSKKPHKIVQFNQIGTEIARYENAEDAATAVSKAKGIKASRLAILRVCYGENKTSYGFEWKYEIDVDGTRYE